MIRATTPTHIFTFPFSVNDYLSKILVTYSQNNKIILEKTLEDLTIEGNTGSYTLTQEETLLFSVGNTVQLQVRALTANSKAIASPIYNISVAKVLNDEVL